MVAVARAVRLLTGIVYVIACAPPRLSPSAQAVPTLSHMTSIKILITSILKKELDRIAGAES
jgi:hypothetical protein